MDDHLVAVERAGRAEQTPEREEVLVVVDGGLATLVLDDGEELRFSRAELRAALGEAA